MQEIEDGDAAAWLKHSDKFDVAACLSESREGML